MSAFLYQGNATLLIPAVIVTLEKPLSLDVLLIPPLPNPIDSDAKYSRLPFSSK
jgi:hypothetical protein